LSPSTQVPVVSWISKFFPTMFPVTVTSPFSFTWRCPSTSLLVMVTDSLSVTKRFLKMWLLSIKTLVVSEIITCPPSEPPLLVTVASWQSSQIKLPFTFPPSTESVSHFSHVTSFVTVAPSSIKIPPPIACIPPLTKAPWWSTTARSFIIISPLMTESFSIPGPTTRYFCLHTCGWIVWYRRKNVMGQTLFVQQT